MKKNHNLKKNKVWISGVIRNNDINRISKFNNIVLWFIVAKIIILGIGITIYLNILGDDYNIYNTSLVIIVILLAIIPARFTNQGRDFLIFFQELKLELTKVIWPSRRETITISIMIVFIVIIFAIIISLFGIIFENFIKYFLS